MSTLNWKEYGVWKSVEIVWRIWSLKQYDMNANKLHANKWHSGIINYYL